MEFRRTWVSLWMKDEVVVGLFRCGSGFRFLWQVWEQFYSWLPKLLPFWDIRWTYFYVRRKKKFHSLFSWYEKVPMRLSYWRSRGVHDKATSIGEAEVPVYLIELLLQRRNEELQKICCFWSFYLVLMVICNSLWWSGWGNTIRQYSCLY